MAKFGVIDLGSNSIRLVIYDVDAQAIRIAKSLFSSGKKAKPEGGKGNKITKSDFQVLLDEKKIAGLSSYVENGVLFQKGIDVASETVSDHLDRAKNVGCKNVGIFATAVLRNCENSKDAVKQIERATARRIMVISGKEEAHLDYVGAFCDRESEDGTLIDIGGGSTELARVKKNEDFHCVSIPQGCVSSYAQFVKMVFPTKKEEVAIEAALTDKLSDLVEIKDYAGDKAFGVGGSIRAAAKMQRAIDSLGKTPKQLYLTTIEDQLKLMEDDPATFAHLAAQAVPDRMHTIGCGLVMLRTLLKLFGTDSLEICRFGVREGYLIKHMLSKD